MTGPESLRQLIEHTARSVAADERFPERQVTALQVLATLELADAVREHGSPVQRGRCGQWSPDGVGDRVTCSLDAEHLGWHEDHVSGMEWSA